MSSGTAVGFFGKLPARGDFVERRLDRGFCRGMDDWLQAGMAASQALLGEAWLPLYLEAPIWRFALGAGVCGPRQAMGVMMPSVDRVGRYFPLVVATHLVAPAVSAGAWFDAAEQLVLTALEEDCTFDQFDAAVSAMMPPDDGAPEGATPRSLWWTWGSAALPASTLITDTLPLAQGFPAFVHQDARRWGWRNLDHHVFEDVPAFDLS